MKRISLCVIAALVLPLAACSGRGSSPLPSAPGVPTAKSRASVTFSMKWSSSQSTALRKPQYVSASARSVSVAVNGGAPQYLNAPATTLTVDAEIGSDTFSFVTYDEQNGQGNALGRASVTKTIVAGTANTVSATLNGVVASLGISLANASPNAGVPATSAVNVVAKDADGNAIVGSGDYSTPITLSIADPSGSGKVSLSNATLQNAAATSALSYTGGALWRATIIASATGVSSVSTAFTPKPTPYVFDLTTGSGTFTAQDIALGGDGNMWFTDFVNNAIGRITPLGVVTEFPIPTANASVYGITPWYNNSLLFTERNASKIGMITTSGVITEYPTVNANDFPSEITSSYFAANGYVGRFNGTAVSSAFSTPQQPSGIALTSSGVVYAAENSTIGIDLSGADKQVALPSGSIADWIVAGPDGNMWFTEGQTGKIGRLQPDSTVTEFATTTPLDAPGRIIAGSDGALWFTTRTPGIGRITTDGVVTEYNEGFYPSAMAEAPDGSIWMTDTYDIVKFVY